LIVPSRPPAKTRPSRRLPLCRMAVAAFHLASFFRDLEQPIRNTGRRGRRKQ
jgi:hypothetical protein